MTDLFNDDLASRFLCDVGLHAGHEHGGSQELVQQRTGFRVLWGITFLDHWGINSMVRIYVCQLNSMFWDDCYAFEHRSKYGNCSLVRMPAKCQCFEIRWIKRLYKLQVVRVRIHGIIFGYEIQLYIFLLQIYSHIHGNLDNTFLSVKWPNSVSNWSIWAIPELLRLVALVEIWSGEPLTLRDGPLVLAAHCGHYRIFQ